MENLYHFIFLIHILSATAALFMAAVYLLRRKEDEIRKMAGQLFVYTILLGGVCTLIMAGIHPDLLLLITGILSLYLLNTGLRYARWKEYSKRSPGLAEQAITYGMLLCGLALTGYGTFYIIHDNFSGIVHILSGAVSIHIVIRDLKLYSLKDIPAGYWEKVSLQRMCGSGIAAAITLFIIHYQDVPAYTTWFMPALLLLPFMLKADRKYTV